MAANFENRLMNQVEMLDFGQSIFFFFILLYFFFFYDYHDKPEMFEMPEWKYSAAEWSWYGIMSQNPNRHMIWAMSCDYGTFRLP